MKRMYPSSPPSDFSGRSQISYQTCRKLFPWKRQNKTTATTKAEASPLHLEHANRHFVALGRAAAESMRKPPGREVLITELELQSQKCTDHLFPLPYFCTCSMILKMLLSAQPLSTRPSSHSQHLFLSHPTVSSLGFAFKIHPESLTTHLQPSPCHGQLKSGFLQPFQPHQPCLSRAPTWTHALLYLGSLLFLHKPLTVTFISCHPPPPVLFIYNWHAALCRFMVYSIMVWLTYIMKWWPHYV